MGGITQAPRAVNMHWSVAEVSGGRQYRPQLVNPRAAWALGEEKGRVPLHKIEKIHQPWPRYTFAGMYS